MHSCRMKRAAAATAKAGPGPSTSSNAIFWNAPKESIMTKHDIVSKEEWLEARRALLAEEKAWTRERDRISEKRRALPWIKLDKDYVFQGADGPVRLSELFDGRSQLIVYHFMFGPEWEEGCTGCSLLSDQVDGARQHFEHHDVSYVAVSRSQLIVYHFMFGPEWEEGCTGCSLLSDQVDGARQHFEHHDVSYVAVSRG